MSTMIAAGLPRIRISEILAEAISALQTLREFTLTERQLIIAAALVMLTGVGAGAFGAHGLKRVLTPDALAIWHTAVLYQMIHGLGMLAVSLLITRMDSTLLNWSGSLMFVGVLVFSGSLYVLTLTGVKWLGAITPIGGVAFIAAWALLALAAYRTA